MVWVAERLFKRWRAESGLHQVEERRVSELNILGEIQQSRFQRLRDAFDVPTKLSKETFQSGAVQRCTGKSGRERGPWLRCVSGFNNSRQHKIHDLDERLCDCNITRVVGHVFGDYTQDVTAP